MILTVLKNQIPISEVKVDTSDSSERYEIYVGRSDDCHVIIDDPLISRHHFVIKNDDGGWACEKLSQLGVVTINGAVVKNNKVNAGDEIKCGPYSVLIADLMTGPKPTPITQTSVEVPKVELRPTPTVEESSQELQVNEAEEVLTTTEATSEAVDVLNSEEASEQNNAFETEALPAEESSEVNFGSDENTEQADFVEPDPSATESFIPATTEAESNENESTRVFKAFVNYQLVLFGEHAPYDRFQLDDNEVYIGRDNKKCQIILNDPEVSTVHAVIRKSNIDVVLEDLNSSNGTILNGQRINKANLSTGDEFVIGSTSFTLEVKSDLLDAESERLMPVESGQVIEKEEILEEAVSSDEATDINFEGSSAPVEKSVIKRIWKDPQQRKKLIYVVAFLGMLAVFLPEEQPESPAPKETKSENPTAKTQEKKDPAKPKLTPEQEKQLKQAYELGFAFFQQQKYSEAIQEFEKVMQLDKNYKNVQSLKESAHAANKELTKLEAERRATEERVKLKKIVEELLVKAREAVKEKQQTVAEGYFSQITEKDPENLEVQQLKMELDVWVKEEERKKTEEAIKVAARKAMVDALGPGKTHFGKKEWYRAILRLEEFLLRKGIDEDLLKEASDMLVKAKDNLAEDLGPILGKARSLKEGQDLKNAYESYLDVLKIEPTNTEALNEVDDIRNQLEMRSKKIYREAIISESLSLFTDAKEKFQEVQQISPSDSEYYRKATDKLKNYLE